MPKTNIYSHTELPAVYMHQAIAFMRTEWPSVFQGEDKFTMTSYPSSLSPVHFVLAEGDALISYAEVLRLELPHAGKWYNIYGFGNMFTFQPYRGEGFGREVLAMATDFIMSSDVDGAQLFCSTELVPFYEKFGWRRTESPTRIGTPDTYESYDAERMMLFVSERCLQNARDFDEHPAYVESPW